VNGTEQPIDTRTAAGKCFLEMLQHRSQRGWRYSAKGPATLCARPTRRSSSPWRPSACRSTWLRRLPRSCFMLWLLVTAPARECPGGIAENRIGEQQEPVTPSATTGGLRRNANLIADNPAAVPNVIQADDDDSCSHA
jgi:hypothetical protein